MKKHKLTLIVEAESLSDLARGARASAETLEVSAYIASAGVPWERLQADFTSTNENLPEDKRDLDGPLGYSLKYEEYESLEFDGSEEGAPSVEEGAPALEEGANA